MGRMVPVEAGSDIVGPEDEARAERIRTLLLVRCLRVDGSAPLLRVRNLSAKGICAVRGAVIDFAMGESVRIEFDRVAPISASVTWMDGILMGLAFRNPISLADLASARAAASAAGT